MRVLFNLCELLERGSFSIRISETPVGEVVRRIKAGQYRPGEVIDLGEYWTEEATRRLRTCTQHARPDLADAFLFETRKGFLHKHPSAFTFRQRTVAHDRFTKSPLSVWRSDLPTERSPSDIPAQRSHRMSRASLFIGL